MEIGHRGFLLVIVIVVLLTVLLFGAGAAALFSKSLSTSEKASVTIGGSSIVAKVVKTPAEKARGLSGRSFLSDAEGMVFVFENPGVQTFWMKGMLIPIDIIWARNGVVVGVEENIPPPNLATAGTLLPRYSSPIEVDMVVEVAAGFSRRHGVSLGSPVTISK